MPVQVLICDDQESFRAAAREVVNATDGFAVVGETETGEESVLAAGRLHPDLVLMDVHLPGIDGLEASRRIRAEHPEVVVVLLSTYDPEEFAARMRKNLSAWQYLVAERGGRIVGYAYGGTHRERAAYRYSVEVSAYVDRACHRQGIGRALYAQLFEASGVAYGDLLEQLLALAIERHERRRNLRY